MRLSSKGRYSTRAMLDLAAHFGQGPIRIKDIAARQQISERYLEQLFIPLRRAGLIRSRRGVRGGFMLAKPPADIRMNEVIQITEGPVTPAKCVDKPELCPQSDVCIARNVWAEIGRATSEVLESTTLQDLLSERYLRLKSKEVTE